MCNISDEGLETRFIVTKVPAGTSEAYVVSFSSEKYHEDILAKEKMNHPFPTRANSVSPLVGCHLGLHSTLCWPLKGGISTQKHCKYTGKKMRNKRKKRSFESKTDYKQAIFSCNPASVNFLF